jgi:MFS family permease
MAHSTQTVDAPGNTVPDRRPGPFFALQSYPAYRRLWFGSIFASLGQWMQNIALGWLALVLTDSPFFVGLIGFMAGLPFLVVSIPAGVLIDRFERRTVLLASQTLAALLAVAVATDVIGGWVEPWHLLLAAFFNGSFQAVLSPTQQALVPSLVQRAHMTNAIALMSAGNNMTRVVGPSISGAVIGLFGTGPAFLLQAAALGVAFLMIVRTRFPGIERSVARPRLSAILDGVHIIRRRPDLSGLFLLACIPTFFVFPYIQFLSVFARDILDIGAGGLGLLMASSGCGAVAGSLTVAARGKTAGAGRQLVWMTVLYGVVIVIMAFSTNVVLSVILLAAGGMLGSSYMSTNNALLHHRITDEVRGRVMGTYMLTWGLMPLGAMPMGIAADHFGTEYAVAAGAMLSILFAGWLGLRSQELRDL